MAGIPQGLETDAEDVVWALQTADALWKRGERADAIVWLRRAAQGAGDAQDDDRALSLAREAAELAESLAQAPAGPESRSVPPAEAPTPAQAVDELLRDAGKTSPPPPPLKPISQPRVPAAPLAAPPARPPSLPKIERVASAAEVHAGILDPWADASSPGIAAAPAPAPAKPPHPPQRPPPAPSSVAAQAPASPPPAPPLPEPPPQRPSPAAAEFDAEEVITSAPPVAPAEGRPAPEVASHSGLATKAVDDHAAAGAVEAPVDLSKVEALSDLPDDARRALAAAAVVSHLSREEEVSGFALALVVEGAVDLSATIVDASAQRLEGGAILRGRGTIAASSPLRLVCASEHATVAVWDEEAAAGALRGCPWVEDDLRAAGDRYQALVGVTMGPLGERLDPSLRSSVTDRLRLLVLSEHEVFATKGEPIRGLLVVGAGELELVGADGVPSGTSLRAGEFLFPSEVLSAAPAPSSVRASRGGALVMLAERGLAQELLVTCPPLLEIFAGA
jgi:hypothetical protein